MTNLQHIIKSLPDASRKQADFVDFSFFKHHRHLPTPAQVRALSPDVKTSSKPKPVVFSDLNVFVKFGPSVMVAEAQNLWMLRRVFPNEELPIPEVFGWRVDEHDDYVYIYMELIRGPTLQDRWDLLNVDDKTSLRDQLCQILKTLRELKQDPSDQYIRSINDQPLLDYVFQTMPEDGPFPSIKAFNDWFSRLFLIGFPTPPKYEDPWRSPLPDTGAIKLTHGDLHRENIIISSTSPARVLAIVDWEQAGWLPGLLGISIVKPFTLVGMKTNGVATGLTNSCVRGRRYSGLSLSIQWQWVPCDVLSPRY